ncbi:MAG TPA: hypothetical protein VNL91_05180 [Thermoanaerobaculia bacterium]|nr:hypothetical protein [Thermoanaerobaculia bacterium]
MPRPARLGTFNVVLSDVSVAGAGIQHHVQIPPSLILPLVFRWESQHLELGARLVRSRLEYFTRGETTLRIYHSGLLFVDRDASGADIRDVIARRVTRALNRQIADAHAVSFADRQAGDSSGGVNLNQLFPLFTPVGRGYIRCTLERGRWKKEWVDTPEQPESGFTVSAGERQEEIELLCRTYSAAGYEERRLIRIFAQLSINEPSEVPRDRFWP